MKKWLDQRILVFAWSFILVICFIIIITSPVKAASLNSGLPYVVTSSEYVNGDGYSINDLQDIYNSKWLNAQPRDFSANLTLAYDYVETIEGFGDFNFTRLIIPTENSTYTVQLSTPYNNFNIFENSAEITFSNYDFVIFSNWGNQYNDCNLYMNQTFTVRFFFDGYLPKYVVGEYDLGNEEDYPVIKDGLVNPTVSGSATEPDLTGDNIGSDKPDIDDYLPDLPNKPTFDDSSLESMVSSLYDFLVWEYNAFTGTIKGLIQYLGDTITYSLQKVIDNIKNSMKNFYDNMKSLFEPLLNAINEALSSISSGIDYIKEPLSGTAIYDNLSGTGIITNYNSIVTAVDSFKDSFTNLNEPSTYTIPIHLEDLPSSMFGDLTTQYIDLSVINSVKPILRTFVWALVTYGLIITIFDSIANYINGGGDE